MDDDTHVKTRARDHKMLMVSTVSATAGCWLVNDIEYVAGLLVILSCDKSIGEVL